MTGQPSYTAAAVKALTAAARSEHDFADFLADVLARVAANLGSTEALTAGRPGSWEASHVDALVYGTTGGDLTPWQQCGDDQRGDATATVYVVLTRDDAERVTDLEVLDAPPLWDLAELGQVAYAANVNGGDAEAWHEGTEKGAGES